MNKLLIALLTTLSIASSNADAHCCWRGGYYHGGGVGWVAPALVGGVIGYELARPNVVVEQPVYVQPVVPAVPQPLVPPVGYHYLNVQDPACNCSKTVLVPN